MSSRQGENSEPSRILPVVEGTIFLYIWMIFECKQEDTLVNKCISWLLFPISFDFVIIMTKPAIDILGAVIILRQMIKFAFS